MSVGSFLGLGGKHVSVPFNALQLTEKNGKRYLVVDTTKEALRSAPDRVANALGVHSIARDAALRINF